MSLLAWIILGLIAGFLASKIVSGSGQGVVMDIVLGIVGAVIAARSSTPWGWRVSAASTSIACWWPWSVPSCSSFCTMPSRAACARPAQSRSLFCSHLEDRS